MAGVEPPQDGDQIELLRLAEALHQGAAGAPRRGRGEVRGGQVEGGARRDADHRLPALHRAPDEVDLAARV